MVIDRIFLWVFVTVCVLGTLGLFLQPLISFLKWDARLRPVSFSLFFCLLLSVSALHLNYFGNYPSCSAFTSDTVCSLLFLSFCLSSLCLMLVSGTPSSAFTSSPQLSCFLTCLSLISPLRLCLTPSMCMQCCYPVSSSASLFFFSWHDYHICSPFLSFSQFFPLSCAMFWPASAYSLSLHFHCVRSSLHFHSMCFIENVHSVIIIVQSFSMFNNVRYLLK